MPAAIHLPTSPRFFLKKTTPDKEQQPFEKNIHTWKANKDKTDWISTLNARNDWWLEINYFLM